MPELRGAVETNHQFHTLLQQFETAMREADVYNSQPSWENLRATQEAARDAALYTDPARYRLWLRLSSFDAALGVDAQGRPIGPTPITKNHLRGWIQGDRIDMRLQPPFLRHPILFKAIDSEAPIPRQNHTQLLISVPLEGLARRILVLRAGETPNKASSVISVPDMLAAQKTIIANS